MPKDLLHVTPPHQLGAGIIARFKGFQRDGIEDVEHRIAGISIALAMDLRHEILEAGAGDLTIQDPIIMEVLGRLL